MENKLVFEPTTLTQYNWNKYTLNESRTYKWDKYEAIPDYLYTYYWNKYVAVPPGPTNQWDVYNVQYPSKPVFVDNLVVQNISTYLPSYKPSETSQYHLANKNCMLRVFRNEDVVISDNNYSHFSGSERYGRSMTVLNATKNGAYLRLSRNWFDFDKLYPYVSDNKFPAYVDNYGASDRGSGYGFFRITPNSFVHPILKIYLAKNVSDIVNNSNLLDLEADLASKGITYTDSHSVIENYINDGYLYSFAPNTSIYGSTGTEYEDGLLTGYSEMYWDNHHLSFISTAPRYSGYYGVPNTNTSYLANDYYYDYPATGRMSFDSTYQAYDLSYAAEDYIGLIGVLNSETVLTYNPQDGFRVILNKLIPYHLDILPSLNYKELYPLVQSDSYPYPSNSLYVHHTNFNGSIKLIRTASISVSDYGEPVKMEFLSNAYNTDINTYPQDGVYGDYWYVYAGEIVLDNYQPGEYIETITSNIDTTYPENGRIDDYWYILIRGVREVISWHKGSYISQINSNRFEYPINGVFPEDLEDYTHFWYSSLGYESIYSRGVFLRTASSFIESSYPNNSYIIDDGWYISIGTEQITVGELLIDNTQLMGGVNYTQEINPSEDLMIGAGGAAQVDFTIYAPDAAAATQYLGKDFTYYVKMPHDTDWRQVGVFTLTKAELPDKQTAKIEGFDYIYKFDVVIDEWLDSLTFPMTLGQLFNSLCEYVGCEAYSTEFNNSNFVVNDNFEAVQITGRTILQYITEVSGGFCVAEPDGRIHIKQYSIPPTGTINLGNDSYVKYTHEIYNVPVITSVVVRKDDEDEGVESNV